MHSRADFPQFRALPLNHCSVSVPAAIHLVAAGGSQAVLHEDTEAREGFIANSGAEAELVVPAECWSGGGDANLFDRAGGGTPP